MRKPNAWFQIAGENWIAGDEWAAVGPAAMGAFVGLVPTALDIIFESGASVLRRYLAEHPVEFARNFAEGVLGVAGGLHGADEDVAGVGVAGGDDVAAGHEATGASADE